MKGHLRERSPGHWGVVLDLRDPETGKRKRKWHSFAGTKREAQVEYARLISELQGGNYLEPSKTMVAQFLDRWLDHIRLRISPRTHERYSEIVRKNIIPALGAVLLTKLRPAQISEAYARALASGRWELLSRNSADAVDPPKIERGTMTTFDMAQTAELLETMRGTRLLIPVVLGVLCGLRRGEIAALRWRNVDLFAGKVAVVESAEQTATGVRYKPPKSGRGRTVALSATVVEELRVHQLQQAEELLRLGIRQLDATFVYAREDGEPMQPRSLTHAWQQILSRTMLPRIRFHDLRHAHATHLLSNGVHPKVASERLGHSRVGITLDLYSHVLPGMQEDAAARVDEALRQALKKRSSANVR